jgi:hypothetical protein
VMGKAVGRVIVAKAESLFPGVEYREDFDGRTDIVVRDEQDRSVRNIFETLESDPMHAPKGREAEENESNEARVTGHSPRLAAVLVDCHVTFIRR